MCTVSFLANDHSFFITSNRDEQIDRATPLQPHTATINNVQITFPKDPKAGGSWFVINEFGTVAVLLNGAFVKHHHLGNYRKSRGLILLEIASSSNPLKHFEQLDLVRIEPFTLILFEHFRLMELRWDGKTKHEKELDIKQPHIYSSCTLYSTEAVKQREALFYDFIADKIDFTEENIVAFHNNDHNDYLNGFVMKRNDVLQTLSITQAAITRQNIDMHHYDLVLQKKYSVSTATHPHQLIKQ